MSRRWRQGPSSAASREPSRRRHSGTGGQSWGSAFVWALLADGKNFLRAPSPVGPRLAVSCFVLSLLGAGHTLYPLYSRRRRSWPSQGSQQSPKSGSALVQRPLPNGQCFWPTSRVGTNLTGGRGAAHQPSRMLGGAHKAGDRNS
jgi:hypothetical protein